MLRVGTVRSGLQVRRRQPAWPLCNSKRRGRKKQERRKCGIFPSLGEVGVVEFQPLHRPALQEASRVGEHHVGQGRRGRPSEVSLEPSLLCLPTRVRAPPVCCCTTRHSADDATTSLPSPLPLVDRRNAVSSQPPLVLHSLGRRGSLGRSRCTWSSPCPYTHQDRQPLISLVGGGWHRVGPTAAQPASQPAGQAVSITSTPDPRQLVSRVSARRRGGCSDCGRGRDGCSGRGRGRGPLPAAAIRAGAAEGVGAAEGNDLLVVQPHPAGGEQKVSSRGVKRHRGAGACNEALGSPPVQNTPLWSGMQ